MAAESSPPKLPATGSDFERPSGPDADLVVPADTFDISTLRPGWRRVDESARSPLPAAARSPLPAAARLVVVAQPPIVPPTAADSPSNVRSEPWNVIRWNVISRRGLIAVGTIALAVLTGLPWLLLWSADDADDRATQQIVSPTPAPEVRPPSTPDVRPASPPEARPPSAPEAAPAPVPAAKVPLEREPTAPPQVRPRIPTGVLPARPRESERRVATGLEQPTVPTATNSSASPERVAPPADATTVSAGRAAPAVSPSTPPPAPVDDGLQPGSSRYEPPTAAPGAVLTPSPAITSSEAITPSPAIPAAPSPVETAAAADERLVVATLRRLARAYEQLDADAVAAVWPHADRRVLTRAFDSIESQQVYFDKCDVQVSESGATASCGGWLTYVPKVGKKDPRSVSRRWDFTLQKGAGEWRITTAAVR